MDPSSPRLLYMWELVMVLLSDHCTSHGLAVGFDPVGKRGTYQVVVVGDEKDSRVSQCAQRLQTSVNGSLSLLGVNPKKFLAFLASDAIGTTLDRRMPSVGVFFGFVKSPTLSPVDADRLEQLLTDGVLIIPVVENASYFKELVPRQIAHLNGISVGDCGGDFERLASRVLEGFELLRPRWR